MLVWMYGHVYPINKEILRPVQHIAVFLKRISITKDFIK